MDSKTVYLNGRYLPLDEAKVSVLDRGFLFGDGIYEVIPAYRGHLFRFHDHIVRLQNSLNSIRITNPHTPEQWLAIVEPLLDVNKDQYIYLQITRGVSPTRDHAFPKSVTPTIFAMCSDISPFSGRTEGIKALTLDDSRWDLCNVKATTLLANVLLRQQAEEQGCAEAILVKNGYVTEGAASNLFAVIEGVLVTPPKGSAILPGITRDVVLELAAQHGVPYREDSIALAALKSASEIWITSSTREIVPVVTLDNQAVSNGKPGPVWQAMNQIFQTYKTHT